MAQENVKPIAPEDTARSGALARGLAVLDVLLDAPHPLTLAEIAKRVGLDLSTVMRLLRPLEESKYVIRVENGKRYAGSPRAISPFPALHPLRRFRKEVVAILDEISSSLKLTVVFVLYLEAERFVLELVQYPGALNPYFHGWLHRTRLHTTASGKALLMTLSPEQRKEFLGPAPYEKVTERTIIGEDTFEKDMALAIRRGYAVTQDEGIVGITGVAANVSNWEGTVIGCLLTAENTQNGDAERVEAIGRYLCQMTQTFSHRAPSIGALSSFLGKPLKDVVGE